MPPLLAGLERPFGNTVEILGHLLQETELCVFQNFGGHHFPLSEQFFGHWRPIGVKMHNFVRKGKP